MSKHTPGPWIRVGEKNCPWGKIKVAEERFITIEGRSLREAEYNASLIAAAPELLEALKRYVESSPCTNGCKKHDLSCDYRFAQHVVAKAEGK